MSAGVFLAIIILLFLILLWLTYIGNDADYLLNFKKQLPNFKKQIDSPLNLYAETVGYNLDADADLALKKAVRREQKYTRAEQAGTLTDYKTAADNSFVIAEVNRFNVLPNTDADIDLQAAILQSYNRAVQRLRHADTGANNTPPAEFIINRAEDYFDEAARPDVPRPRFNVIRDKVRKRKSQNIRAAKRNERVQKQTQYYNNKQIHSDPQNVHESQATHDLSQKFARIRELNGNHNEPYVMPDVYKFINNYRFRSPDHKTRALTALKFISAGNEISKLNTTEDRVLLNVWKRIHDPANDVNRNALLDSLMDNLTDCVEIKNGAHKEVCAGGRTARVLNSLILLDTDSQISMPVKTAEILKNEIFTKTHKLITDELRAADPETVRAYNGEIDNPELLTQFEIHLREIIEKNIRDTYTNTDKRILDNIIKDALAGV